MLLIPAVDIRDGRCVRLKKGRIENETVYDEDPVNAACSWEKEGAKRLHVVDLDGAFSGRPRNIELIKEILTVAELPVQIGGGIRNLDVVEEYLTAGAQRVVLGTIAARNPELAGRAIARFGAEHIAVGVDVDQSSVAVEGWVSSSGRSAVEVAEDMKERGARHVIYTDVSRDGTLEGIRLLEIEKFMERIQMSTIISGGIGSLADLRRVRSSQCAYIEGVIVGQALYTGEIEFSTAQGILEEGE